MDDTSGHNELIFRYLDEMASADQHAELDRLLVAAPEVAKQLVAMVRLDALLGNHFRDAKSLDTLQQKLAAREAAQTGLPIPAATLPVAGLGSEVPGTAGLGIFMWTTVGLLGTIAGGVLLMIGLMFFGARPSSHEVAQRKPETRTRPADISVARLTRTVDCRWADVSNAPRLNGELRTGRKLQLKSGLAEIVFQSGAKVLLQGPTEFDVRSAASGYLQRGKLTVTVEEPLARGFEIHTPGMKYTDLGTEFGVLVADDGAQEVDVFRGKVQAEAVVSGRRSVASEEAAADSAAEISNPKSPIPHPKTQDLSPKTAPIVLKADEAIRVGKPQGHAPVAIVRQAAKPEQFVRIGQLEARLLQEASPDFRRWKKLSDDLRQRGDLLAYYDFQPDDSDRTVLRNRAATGRQFDGKLVGGAEWTAGRFPGKQAIRIDKAAAGGRVKLSVPVKELTLAAWVQLDWPKAGFGTLLASNSWMQSPGQMHWRFITPGVVSVAFAVDPRSGTAISIRSATVFHSIDSPRWHLVATTWSAKDGKLRHYYDGHCILGQGAPSSLTPNIGEAMIGNWDHRKTLPADPRPLMGRMDELMIFGSASTGKAIQEMFTAGNPVEQAAGNTRPAR